MMKCEGSASRNKESRRFRRIACGPPEPARRLQGRRQAKDDVCTLLSFFADPRSGRAFVQNGNMLAYSATGSIERTKELCQGAGQVAFDGAIQIDRVCCR